MMVLSSRRLAARIALALTVVCFAAVASADNSSVGTSAYQFLKIGVGARQMGMGGANVAVGGDAQSIFWNPAGLSMVQRPECATNYLSYFSGVNSGGAAFAQPVGKMSTVGFGLQFLRIGGIPTTTLENQTGEGLDEFAVNNLALSMGYAGQVRRRLFVGASASYIYEGVSAFSGFSSSAGTINAGFLYRTSFHSIAFGGAVRNLGGQFSFYSLEKEDLPLTFVAGIALRPLSDDLLVAIDVEKPRDNDPGALVGVEYQPVRDFFVRTGYRAIDSRIGDDATSNGDLAGWSFGVGVAGTRRYKIDYAYTSFADLGDAHRFSFAYVLR
ncbi:MAG: PorV/PorQ family protein [bacterium]